MSKFIDRTGLEGFNNFGSRMIIVRCRNCRDIDVYFPEYDWTAYNRSVSDFNKGKISCPYERNVCGVGYLGNISWKDDRQMYKYWENMIRRAYSSFNLKNHKTYENVIVSDEFQCFENFAIWGRENYYECNDELMCLDKDILFKGNKIYSAETCIFVPHRINVLFVKKDANRGDLPIGVCWDKSRNKYQATWRNANSKIRSKRFNTIEEAFNCYKINKEKVIKQVADEYKDLIPEKLYLAMYNYEVEITD